MTWKQGLLLRIEMGRIPSRIREILEGKFWTLYMKISYKDIFTQHILNMPVQCWYLVSRDTKLRLAWCASQVAPCLVTDTQGNHRDVEISLCLRQCELQGAF